MKCTMSTNTTLSATLPRSSILDAQLAWLERHLNRVPYVERLREQKSAFPGEERQRYMLSPSRFAARPLLALFSACGVRLSSLLGPKLFESLMAPYREKAAA